MKKLFGKLDRWDEKHPFLMVILNGVILTVVIECLNQRSVAGCVRFLVSNPVMFGVNALIVTSFLSVTLLFKKRRCGMVFISLFFLLFAIVNFVIRTFRTTPLRAVDFRVAKSVMTIVNMYMKPWQIALSIAAVAAVVLFLVILWIKTRKIRPKYIRSILAILLIFALTYGSMIGARNIGAVATHFDNVTNAYTKYGLVYCFGLSLFDNGISKPDVYNEENIKRILTENEPTGEVSSKRPNIVYVQLESFFDVNKLKRFTYSQQPIPNFLQMKQEWPTGILKVASFGTGTANTEFDVLTGMNVQFFGAGEYPYSTVLREKTCDSINFELKKLGYKTHAIHNHAGNFYARNKVYPHLGFDTFTSQEYMLGIERNALGWAKDKILTGQILDTLNSTEEQDFIFAVSVQPHGRYSEEVVDENQTITLEGAATEGEKNAYEYYINQCYETDAFVKELTDTLDQFPEPTVVVFYGDHLPNTGMVEEDLIDGASIYDSEYIIWNNYGKKLEGRDLCTYQLSAHVTSSLGFHDWTLAKLHENNDYDTTNLDYMRDLQMVEYDALYGKQYYYGDEGAPESAEMTMGIKEITMDSFQQIDDDVHIYGQNFTESSVVSLGGDRYDTIFVSPEELVVEGYHLEIGDAVRVFQMASSRSWLSRTPIEYYLLGPEALITVTDMNELDAERNGVGHMIPGHIDKEETAGDQ
ncbi:MAG: LTA synthase family protein [Firmicutes bacterium]|nr:LTA synthase family protein [Bacillota bacterium]